MFKHIWTFLFGITDEEITQAKLDKDIKEMKAMYEESILKSLTIMKKLLKEKDNDRKE